MNLNAFKNLPTQRTDRTIHNARVNPEHINYIVPSGPDRVGACLLTMAADLAGGSVLAPTDDLATLARMFNQLTSAQVYNTASASNGGSALVNMARVALIEEKGAYAILSFVDGGSLNIVKTWP
ncbi:hypothetical protein ACFPOU_07735 [Massilia jejuensis]|uniref:Uncharacterized protein n=1 Tax=Massilia jejuensis TaxID=648894 RepID=A0ABW0PKB5_9BURK